jgi:S1-C subfamily serine protease
MNRPALRTLVALVAVAVVAAATLAPAATRRDYESSVVGLIVSHQTWNEDYPWLKHSPQTRVANAVVVEAGDGTYLLTSANMLENAVYVQLLTFGRRTSATVTPVLVDEEVNLALLSVDDPAVFADLEPARLADEVPVEGVVYTVRWKDQQLETLSSRIKRFEVAGTWYGHQRYAYLVAQSDMTGGGWAEPVFDDGRLVGLNVAQRGQQLSVVPVELLRTFLERAAAGPEAYDGFPVLGVRWQVHRDPATADLLGQDGPPRGLLIRQIPWGSSGCGVLEPRDIVLSIDGRAIDDEGNYTHPRLGQVEFGHHIAAEKEVGEVIPVQVLRDGRVLDLDLELRRYTTAMNLMPEHRRNAPPPYAIVGGLLLRELDGDYLRSWRDWQKNAPIWLVGRYLKHREAQTPERRRVVLLAAVIPSDYTVGYHGLRDLPIAGVNGQPVDSIADVVAALEHPVGGLHTITFVPNDSREEIVLDAAGLAAATAAILERYEIPAPLRLPERDLPELEGDCSGDW